jgi:hypothetical protein
MEWTNFLLCNQVVLLFFDISADDGGGSMSPQNVTHLLDHHENFKYADGSTM